MAAPLTETGALAERGELAARLARLIREQFGFVWRLLRCIGVTELEADSAVQEVFAAAAQRIGDIRSGSERSFLLSTTLHVAARARRNRGEQAALSEGAPALEDLDEQRQAREILGALLEQMPLELRVVFVLSEVERLPNAKIAEIVGIPGAMVSSRLSEAQEDFATHLETESELSQSLIAAAREEQPPPGALVRALRAAGIRADIVSDSEASALSSPGSGRLNAAAAQRSPFALSAKWLALGWVVGLAAALTVYALTDTRAVAAPHSAVAH